MIDTNKTKTGHVSIDILKKNKKIEKDKKQYVFNLEKVVEIVSQIEYLATSRLTMLPVYDNFVFSTGNKEFKNSLLFHKKDIVLAFTSILSGNKEITEIFIELFSCYFQTKFGIHGPENIDHIVELFEGTIKIIMLAEEE